MTGIFAIDLAAYMYVCMCVESWDKWRRRTRGSYKDILHQTRICRLILRDDVGVKGTAADGAAEEETEKSVVVSPARVSTGSFLVGNGPVAAPQTSAKSNEFHTQISQTRRSRTGERDECIHQTYPPRNAPIGFRAGMGAAAPSSKRREVWKLRAGVRRAGASDRAPVERVRAAISVGQVAKEISWNLRRLWWSIGKVRRENLGGSCRARPDNKNVEWEVGTEYVCATRSCGREKPFETSLSKSKVWGDAWLSRTPILRGQSTSCIEI
jgi:hypothetical protein